MGPLNPRDAEREAYYNAERRRQSLGWLSPVEYLAEQRLRMASCPPCLICMERVQQVDTGKAGR